jgi:hypothetical protein
MKANPDLLPEYVKTIPDIPHTLRLFTILLNSLDEGMRDNSKFHHL